MNFRFPNYGFPNYGFPIYGFQFSIFDFINPTQNLNLQSGIQYPVSKI